jgi:hypothetical protein
MSFHRTAFLIWLAVMTLFVITASAIGTYSPNDEFKASAINELIEAASGHAKVLRDSASAANDQTARTAKREAERWWLVTAARTELLDLRRRHAAHQVSPQLS